MTATLASGTSTAVVVEGEAGPCHFGLEARLLGRLAATLRLLRSPPGRLGVLLQQLDLSGLLLHRFALPGELGHALRRAPARSAQRDSPVADALQQLVQLRVMGGSFHGLPGVVDGCLLLRLDGLRRFDGRSERGGFPVFRKPLKQWMLRITAYADRLVADLDRLDWPDSVKTMQRNWIGRSEGLLVRFALDAATTPPGETELEVTSGISPAR